MGTHRSKHNKGVKPLYKNVDRDSVRFFHEEDQKAAPAKIVPLRRSVPAAPKNTSVDALVADVDAYLKKRDEAVKYKHLETGLTTQSLIDLYKKHEGTCFYCGHQTKLWAEYSASVHPKSKGGTDDPSNLVLCCYECNQNKGLLSAGAGWDFTRKRIDEPELVRRDFVESNEPITQRGDIVLRLFREKKIGFAQLVAARNWQILSEQAILQPAQTVDWSEPVQYSVHYQRSGDLSEKQWSAVKRRREAIEMLGRAAVVALDAILAPDARISELRMAWRMTSASAERAVITMLEKLSHFYGFYRCV